MTVSFEQQENSSVLRLEGDLTVTSAAELKGVLMEAFSGGDLVLDLERAEDIDLAVMQLLWATGREAERRGVSIRFRTSEAASMAARDVGFEQWPR